MSHAAESVFTFHYGLFRDNPITRASDDYLRWTALNARPKSCPDLHVRAADEIVRRMYAKADVIDPRQIDEKTIDIIVNFSSDADARLLVLPRHLEIEAAREAKRIADANAREAYHAADASQPRQKPVTCKYLWSKGIYDSRTAFIGLPADVKAVVEPILRASAADCAARHEGRPTEIDSIEAAKDGRIRVTIRSSSYVGH